MKATRFNKEQIIRILHEQESGITTAEICRKHGVFHARTWAVFHARATWAVFRIHATQAG